MIDLHCHSTYSDGELTPYELAARAKEINLKALSLTDHDTVDGLDECKAACAELGVKFIPGIEFSTFAKREIHILGYNINYKNPAFLSKLSEAKKLRIERNRLLFEKLESLGIKLDLDPAAQGMGRALAAKKMVEMGVCKTTNEAFEVYLGSSGKAYVQSKRLTPVEAVTLIKGFDGAPVLAHPKAYIIDGTLESIVQGLKYYGLMGIEVYYPTHTEADVKLLQGVAAKFDLIKTSGSDFHSPDEQYHFTMPDLDEKTKKTLGI